MEENWRRASAGRQQVAQLSQRDRAAGCVSFGQKWKTGTGRQYFTDIIGLTTFFAIGVTAEALRANILSKLAISLQWGPVDPQCLFHSSSQKTRLNDPLYGAKI